MFQLDQAARGQFARERAEELARSARRATPATTANGRGRHPVVRLTPAVREHLYRAFVARSLVAGVAGRAAANDGEHAYRS